MKSSLKSKLFLITYGTILAFIAGLIIFNNTVLRSYYRFRRDAHLIEAFEVYNDMNESSNLYIETLMQVESEKNISIQVIYQPQVFEDSVELEDYLTDTDWYLRIYGNPYTIPHEQLANFIYAYQHGQGEYDLRVSEEISDDVYDGYSFTMNEEQDLIGLFAVKSFNQGYLYYFNTFTTSSIDENIWIFNSFTVVIGMFFMVASGIVMYIMSDRLTNPILQINRVADEIANLDFSNKIDVKSDDEIGHLAKSVNKMSDELSQNIEELKVTNKRLADEILYKNNIEKLRKEFIASASHELKTPLSLIMGYAEALRLEDISKEDYDAYIAIILDETNKMNKLVREMLNIGQIESGNMTIKKTKFSLKKLVQSTYKLLQIKLDEKEVDVVIDVDDVMVSSDYEQLQTVLINFINNAMNHMSEPNRLTITSKKFEDVIRLSVHNTGQAIPEEDINYLWDSFYKVDKSRTRSYGGHGLGLAICRSIFEALNYHYGVENTQDGVKFFFDIKTS